MLCESVCHVGVHFETDVQAAKSESLIFSTSVSFESARDHVQVGSRVEIHSDEAGIFVPLLPYIHFNERDVVGHEDFESLAD